MTTPSRTPSQSRDGALFDSDLALVNDLIYTHGGDAALAGWVRIVGALRTAAPPVVGWQDISTAAESPGGWLIKDFADGWFWTGHRITAVAALTEGHAVYDISRQAYAPPPPASVSPGGS